VIRTAIIAIALLLLGFRGYGQVVISANNTAGCAPLPVVIQVVTPDASSISTYGWTVTTPLGATLTSAGSQFIGVFTVPGSYTVSLTLNGNPAQSVTQTAFITVYQPPVAAISVDDPLGCVPHCVSYSDASTAGTGQLVAWSWDFGNGALSNQQNPDYCYQNAGNYTPFLSVTDEFGCFSSVSMPQLVSVTNNQPQASFTPDTFTDCNPPSTVNFANNSLGNGIVSSWDFGNGFSQSTVSPSPVSTTFSAFGDYEVCLTVTDDIGCAVVACETISIVSAPTPEFTASDDIICAGGYVDFVNTSDPMPLSVSWDFDGDGIEDATGNQVSWNYATPGIFNPTITATYSANCVGTSSGAGVEVLPTLSTSFSSTETVSCAVPFTVEFTNTSTGSGFTAFSWLVNGVQEGVGVDFTYTFGGEGTYDIGLVVETAQCVDTLFAQDYIVIQPPTVTFNLPAQICTGTPVPVSNIQLNSNDPVTNIEWDFDGDGIIDAVGMNPAFAFDTPGVYIVDVYLETQSGCTNVVPASSSITVQPGVVADFTSNNQVSCAGEPIQFCVENMVQNTIYAWNFGVGLWQNVGFPNECVEYTYQDTGFFDVTLSVYNTACNALIVLEDHIYIAPPVADFTFALDCADLNTVAFTDNSIGADSLVWDFGDGSPLLYNELNPTHTFPGPGTWQVTLTAFNLNTGCEDDQVINVVNTSTPIALNAQNPSGCGPHTTGFTSPQIQQYVEWVFDFGNGFSSMTSLHPLGYWQTTVSGPTGSTSYNSGFLQNWIPQITFQNQGTYDVTVTATDPGGCSYTYVYEDLVTVYNDPIFAQFNANVIDDCDQVIVEFTPTGNFLDNGTWTFGDGNVQAGLNVTHEFTAPWDYQFTATFNVVDDFGCSSTVTSTLPIVAPPVPGFEVLSDPSCISEEVQVVNTSTGNIVGFQWDFGDPSSPDNISTENSTTHAYLNNGSYTICLTAENTAGCQQSACVDNAVNIISPVAEMTYTPQIANCLFGVQFENTTQGELVCSEWSFGDGQFGGGLDPYHTYSIGVYDVQLVVCNEFGCYDTTTVFDIFNLSNVIGPFTLGLDAFDCAPYQVDFSAYNITDQQFTYFWDFGDGSGDPDNNTVTTHAYVEPGSYFPTLVMEDPNGCIFLQTSEDPIVVTEFTIDVTPPQAVCFGQATLIEVSGADAYTFSNPEMIEALGGGVYSITAPETTVVTIDGTFADCLDTQSITVEIYQLPEVELSMQEGVCFGAPEIALNGGLPAGPSSFYTVDGALETAFDPSMPANANYEVVYTYTDGNGCINADTTAVTIWALPTVELAAFDPLCELDAPIILEGGSPLNGVYTVNGQTAAGFDPSDGFGSYAIGYAFTDGNQCASTAEAVLVVNPSPAPVVSPPILCWEPELTVESTSTIAQGSIVGYSWDLNGNGPDTGQSTATLTTPGPGSVDVSLTVTSDQGCEASVALEIPVYATPVAAFSVEDVCENTPLVVEQNSSTEGEPISGYVWSVNGELFSNAAQPNPLSVDDWGTYVIELTVESPEGCTDTETITATVSPLPIIDLVAEAICAGETAVVFANTAVPGGGNIEYSWTDGQGNTGISTENLSAVYGTPGEFTVVLNASSGPGCSAEGQIVLTVNPTPVADFTWESTAFCANASTSLFDNSSIAWGEVAAWEWSVNGDPFAIGEEVVFSATDAGEYSIGLVVFSEEGCSNAIVLPGLVEVWPNPVANFFVPEGMPSTAAPFINVTDRSEDAESWLYTLSDGAVYTDAEFTHEFSVPGLYSITQFVTNGFGCTDSLHAQVEFEPELLVYVPNAFTPDNDGLNEVFKPVLFGASLNHYRFTIINRWGEVVFDSTDPSEGWLGNFRGGDHYVQSGAYVWQLEVGTVENRIREQYNGHVTVVR
jgi:gliding motility-associated-like protein